MNRSDQFQHLQTVNSRFGTIQIERRFPFNSPVAQYRLYFPRPDVFSNVGMMGDEFEAPLVGGKFRLCQRFLTPNENKVILQEQDWRDIG